MSASVRPSRFGTCRGFTLIELLVAIGIVAALAALLLPAIAGAWRSVSQVNCASNLRQWAVAAHHYAVANRGYLPRRGQGVQPTVLIDRPQDWFNALPPHLSMRPYSELAADGERPRPGGGSSIWICPEALDGNWTNYWSYGMNMALSVEQLSQNNGKPDNIAGVGNTSTMVLMADGPGNYCSVFPSRFVGGYNPAARHNGYVNIAFLDGHVAPFKGDYIGVGTGLIQRPDARWRPPRSTWNSAQ